MVTWNPNFQVVCLLSQCRVVNDLTRNAKEAYYSSIIEANHGNQQMLFQVINTLLYRKPLVRFLLQVLTLL